MSYELQEGPIMNVFIKSLISVLLPHTVKNRHKFKKLAYLAVLPLLFGTTVVFGTHPAHQTAETKDTAKLSPETTKDPKAAFKEYHAVYQLNWHGMNVGVSEHELRRVGQNTYSAESVSKPHLAILPFNNYERSEFLFEDSKLKPLRYDFKTEEKGKTIVGLVQFDWPDNSIRKSVYQGAERDEPLPENALDRITYTLQLRKDLQNSKGPFTYTVVEPRKIKKYTFNIVGEEKVNTLFGEFNAVKLEHVSENGERRTQLWLAKDFDYLLVKLTQYKKDSLDSEAILKQLKVISPNVRTQTNMRSGTGAYQREVPQDR